MKTPRKLLGFLAITLGILPGAATLSAQAESSGLLGKRYLAAAFGHEDLRGASSGFFGTALSLNWPLTTGFDAGVEAGHSWLEGDSDVHAAQVTASVTGYLDFGAWRPFVRGRLGHGEISFGSFDDSVQFFGADLGVEYLLTSSLSAQALVAFDDDFEPGNNSEWSGDFQLSYWASRRVVVSALFSLAEEGDRFYGLRAGWLF